MPLGAPGVRYRQRYAGDHDDAANNAKLLSALNGVPDEKETATSILPSSGLSLMGPN